MSTRETKATAIAQTGNAGIACAICRVRTGRLLELDGIAAFLCGLCAHDGGGAARTGSAGTAMDMAAPSSIAVGDGGVLSPESDTEVTPAPLMAHPPEGTATTLVPASYSGTGAHRTSSAIRRRRP